jgi:hypothetical protein
MADNTTTPSMNLVVPIPSTAPGPAWATTIAGDMTVIDAHDHTSGKGVPITPDALNINTDLPVSGNNVIDVRTTRYTPEAAPISEPSDLGCTYVVDDDLYFNDGAGNQIRLTQGGSVSGSSGTITGLPSGTASASFSGGTFSFRSATNTPATMSVGPITTGAAIASPFTVTIAASASQASNYSLTYPLALPGSTSLLNVDTSGNMGYAATTGSGAVVLSTGPTITNAALTATNATLTTPTITNPTITAPTVTGPILNTNGSAAAPSYTFTGDTGTGVYRVSANTLGLSSNGTAVVSINTAGAYNVGGSSASPSWTFTSDSDTGMYNSGVNQIGFAAGGSLRAAIGTSGVSVPAGFGIESGGGGYIKWYVFTGTLSSGASTTLDLSGSTILGATGFTQVNNGTTYRVMDTDSTKTNQVYFNGTGSDTDSIRITNTAASNSNDYRVVVYYQ